MLALRSLWSGLDAERPNAIALPGKEDVSMPCGEAASLVLDAAISNAAKTK